MRSITLFGRGKPKVKGTRYPNRLEKIKRLRIDEKQTLKSIAAEVGVTIERVRQILNKAGIDCKKPPSVPSSYRVRKKMNGGKIKPSEWEWLKKHHHYTCLKCGRKEPEIKLTLDHIKPLVLGGKTVIENAQPLCGSCNSSKGTKWIDYRK